MRIGDIVRTTSITAHFDGPSRLREGWKCRKGYRYVFLLLAVEEVKKPVNAKKSLQALGWEIIKP
jgi:hypothetical protein